MTYKLGYHTDYNSATAGNIRGRLLSYWNHNPATFRFELAARPAHHQHLRCRSAWSALLENEAKRQLDIPVAEPIGQNTRSGFDLVDIVHHG